MWVMRGFEFRLCFSVSLSLSLSLSSESVSVVCFLLISVRCREICLLYRFYLLVGSDWVFFVFYREGHGLSEKLLLIIFIFWQISSTFCYAQKPLFSILKKVSAPITSGECSRGRSLQSLFRVNDKLERDLFRPYNRFNISTRFQCQKFLFQTIQFSISTQFSSIYP